MYYCRFIVHVSISLCKWWIKSIVWNFLKKHLFGVLCSDWLIFGICGLVKVKTMIPKLFHVDSYLNHYWNVQLKGRIQSCSCPSKKMDKIGDIAIISLLRHVFKLLLNDIWFVHLWTCFSYPLWSQMLSRCEKTLPRQNIP